MRKVGFLHTAAVHEATFDRLLAEAGPAVTGVHVVDEALLTEAVTRGVTPELNERVRRRLTDLCEQDVAMIVCTCSTLGGLAEAEASGLGLPIIRVDRPMAERAASIGGLIGVVYAVESTAAPTFALLDECIAAAGTAASVVVAPCLDAWALFEAGDIEGYLTSISGCGRRLAPGVDVIVLAQASMAPAALALGDLGIPVLSSPAAAVQRVSALLR